MKSSITTILVIFAILFTTTMIAADPTDAIDALKMYDMNGDGIIDADERIALDIDIEQLRLTFAESEIADRTASDGTIILSTEFRELATNTDLRDGTSPIVTTITVVPETTPVIEPTAEVTTEPTTEAVVEAVVETKSGMTTTAMVMGILIVIGIVLICLYIFRDKDSEE